MDRPSSTTIVHDLGPAETGMNGMNGMNGSTGSIADEVLRYSKRDRVMLARRATMDHRVDAITKPHAEATLGAPESEQSPRERGPSGDLTDTVVRHIIPRLLLATHGDVLGSGQDGDARGLPTPAEVAGLAELAVTQDLRGAMAQIEALRGDGASLETILLSLIAPAGRLLGEQWLDDEKSFTEVALGVGTLHHLLTMLRQRLIAPLSRRGTVLLLTPPGERHTLAIYVLGDLLRHAGWDAVVEPNLAEDDLTMMVASVPMAMVGISVSCSSLVDAVGAMVARVRDSSVNREILVMLGGAADLTQEASSMGAAYCPSARFALELLGRREGVWP